MIDQKNGPVEFTPADMPRDNAGNIAYEHGNFFQSKEHSDGLPRPAYAREPRSWPSMIVDPDILSRPAPNWQHPNSRYGLILRVHAGPFFDLGYQGHCHACRGYFLNYEWAQDHKCHEEQAFRDITRREIRDYPALRKVQKQLAATKRKKCNKKKRYGTKIEAEAHCERMLARVPLQLTPMEPYFCYRHQAWHVGHNWLRYNTERGQRW